MTDSITPARLDPSCRPDSDFSDSEPGMPESDDDTYEQEDDDDIGGIV